MNKDKTPNPATIAALVGICLFMVLQIVTGIEWFGWIAAGCLILLPVVGWNVLRFREKYLLALAAVVAFTVLSVARDPGSVLATAVTRGAYLAAFIMLLSMLRDAATTSGSVLAIGKTLTRQPPGRRYWTIALGGHAMGVIMNFGALSLLGPLVQRGARAGSEGVDPRIAEIREQRQLSALSRGFSWFIAWSPTAISQLIAVTVVTGTNPATVALFGACTAAMVIGFGWLDDRATGLKARHRLTGGRPLQPQPPEPFPRGEFGRLMIVYAMLIIVSTIFAYALSLPLVTGIMLAALPATLLWISAQIAAGRGQGRSFFERARDLAVKTIPDGSPEAITLALAGFIGTALATVVPGGGSGSGVFFAAFPPAFTYVLVVTLVPLASLAGLPAMLMVTFLGTYLSDALAGHINPDLLALALVCGWAVNLTGSPFGGTNLILSRITAIPATRLAFPWNGLFSVGAWAICVAVLVILSALAW